MTAITNFVRKTPAASLRAYFSKTGIVLVPTGQLGCLRA